MGMKSLLYTHGYEEYLLQKAAKQMPCVVPDTALNKCPYYGDLGIQLSVSLARRPAVCILRSLWTHVPIFFQSLSLHLLSPFLTLSG